MPDYHGGCTCSAIRYILTLQDSSTDARTTLCHCESCKRTFGVAYGLTTKVALTAFYSPKVCRKSLRKRIMACTVSFATCVGRSCVPTGRG